jgi:hypothetical protein
MEFFWKNYLSSIQKPHYILDPKDQAPAQEEPSDFFTTTQDIILSQLPAVSAEQKTDDFLETAQAGQLSPPRATAESKAPPPEMAVPSALRPPDPTAELIRAVQSLSVELGQIRKILEQNLDRGLTTASLPHKEQRPNPIKLDLDAFMGKQGFKG